MTYQTTRNPLTGLGLSTALAAVFLAGCAGGSAPQANISAADAVRAMDRGETSRAIAHAEAAVEAEPRNAEYRMVLGNAYLDEGRFASASAAFADAMALGENSPRAALSQALALTGEGRFAEASTLLRAWEGEIAASDVGLAYALAGEPARGIHLLSNAIRSGDNTVKTRQNLAYAYAVAGRWREARLMVAQDVPADQVGARMEEWAQMAHAGAYQHRLAALLDVPAGVRDAGQPVHLALANHPHIDQLVAEGQVAPPATPALAAGMELPPVGTPAASASGNAALPPPPPPPPPASPRRDVAPASFAQAFGDTPRPVRPANVAAPVADATPAAAAPLPPLARATPTARYADTPVAAEIRNQGAARQAGRRTPRAASPDGAASRRTAPAASAAADGSHLVQLGSFSSERSARRAWDIYVSRHPALADHEMVITQAVVNGRNYWRVSAGGFNTASSRAMCSSVNASRSGEGCISWAAARPLPGALDTGVRLARR